MDATSELPPTDDLDILTSKNEGQEIGDLNVDNLLPKNTNLSSLIISLISHNNTEIEALKKQVDLGENKDNIDTTKLKKSRVICRLCLSLCQNNTGKTNSILDSKIQNMVECILPEVKLLISSDPLFCMDCLTTLNCCYNFKISCQEVEAKVQDMIKNDDIVKLKKLWPTADNQSICRMCLKVTSEKDCVKLYSSEDDPLKNMVDKCLPDIDISASLTKDPLMCPQCLENLEEQFNFVMQCLDTEDKINFFCEEKDIQAEVDLYKVYLFSQCIEGDTENVSEGEDETFMIDNDGEASGSKTNVVRDGIDTQEHEEESSQKFQISDDSQHSDVDFGKDQTSNKTSTTDPLSIEPMERGISFVDIPETRDHNELENESCSADFDPLGDFEPSNRTDDNTSNQNHSGHSQNADNDDCFEEEEVPNKRARVEMDDNTPYPVNMIQAIRIDSLNEVPIEDLSNIPIIDASMNTVNPTSIRQTVSKTNKPKEKSKDILAQLLDEINVLDSDQLSDDDPIQEETSNLVYQKTSNFVYQYESLDDLKNIPETVYNDDIPPNSETTKAANRLTEDNNISTSTCNSFSGEAVNGPVTSNTDVDIKMSHLQPLQPEQHTSNDFNNESKIDLINSQALQALGSENLTPNDDSNIDDSRLKNSEVDTNQEASPVPALSKKPSTNTMIPKKDKPWIKCDKCTFRTKNPQHLKQHEGAHTLENDETILDLYVCQHCHFETKFHENFQLHSKLHEYRPIYTCAEPGCDFQSKTGSSALAHKKMHERRKDKQKMTLKCTQCDFQTALITQFRQHEILHRKKLYKCEICAFETKTKMSLKTHIRQHEVNVYKTRSSSRKSKSTSNEEP